jgi:hypothetical protein
VSAAAVEIAAVVVGGSLLALLTAIAVKARKSVKAVGLFLRDWQGEPARPGVDARPGVLERLDTLEHKVADIHHEVKPNGGNSIKDAVGRIDLATSQPAHPVTVNVGSG